MITKQKLYATISRYRWVPVWVLVLGLVALYRFVGETVPAGEYFTVYPPVAWLCLLVPVALLGMQRKRRVMSLLSAGSVLLFLIATEEWVPLLRGILPAARTTVSSQELRLKVVTWNIDGGAGGNRKILEAVSGADICFFQETPDGAHSFSAEDLTGEWKGFHWVDAGDCGVLSRYPLRTLPTKMLGLWSDPQVLLADLPASRTLVLMNVRLMLPSLILDVWHPDERHQFVRDNRVRRGQFISLAQLAGESVLSSNRGLLLAGDFNTGNWSKLLRPLKDTGLIDVWPRHGRGWGRTMARDFPIARIDQIWCWSNELRPIRAWAKAGPSPIIARSGRSL